MTITLDHLPEPVEQFIQAQLAMGRYQSPEELVESILIEKAEQVEPVTSERTTTMGRFAHLGISVSQDDIRTMRNEAWANFPRDMQ